MNQTLRITDRLVIIRPLCSVWSGAVSVNRDTDLQNVKDQLPSSEVMTDGQKKLVANDRLSKLKSLRTGIPRQLLSLGFDPMETVDDNGHRNGSGFIAVLDTVLPEAVALLEDAKRRFYDYLDGDLIPNLDTYYEEQEQKLPGDKAFLRENRRSPGQVRSACRFTWALFHISPAKGEAAEQSFAALEENAVPALIAEIAREAWALWDGSFKGRDTVTQKAANAARRLVEKIETYSIIDGRLFRTATALRKLIEGISDKGPLDELETFSLGAVLRRMADGQELLAIGERARAGQGADDDEDEASDVDAAAVAVDPAAEQLPMFAGVA
jgi:hypothetical protein